MAVTLLNLSVLWSVFAIGRVLLPIICKVISSARVTGFSGYLQI